MEISSATGVMIGDHNVQHIRQISGNLIQVGYLSIFLPPPGLVDRPGQLPFEPAGFIGRADALARLNRLLADDCERMAMIVGTAGVGKTALAVRWANSVRDHFADGIVYMNLRGYDPEDPMSPMEAASSLLRSLGVSGDTLPDTLAERTAVLRSLVSDRRMLFVYDNVREARQVRPLLPGGKLCTVLVTSRDRLAGLMAREGALSVPLPRFTVEESQSLLDLLAPDRFHVDETATRALIDLCAGLPIALRLASQAVLSSPKSVAEHMAELRADALEFFDADGDEETALRAIFSWSVRQLDSTSASAFRLLGSIPGGDVGLGAVGALLDRDVGQAAQTLRRLVGAHLLEELGAERFHMHDLLRNYAAELAEADSGLDVGACRARVAGYYLDGVATAHLLLHPNEVGPMPTIDASLRGAAAVPQDLDAARQWLDQEISNIVAMTLAIGEPVRLRLPILLAAYLHRYLYNAAYCDEAIITHQAALQAATTLGDPAEVGRACHNLGTIHWRTGDLETSLRWFTQALAARRDAGDPLAIAASLNNMGNVLERQGRYADSLACHQEALIIRTEAGDRAAIGQSRNNVGLVRWRLGDYEAALLDYECAAEIAREEEDLGAVGDALANMAVIYNKLGRYDLSLSLQREALRISRQLKDPAGEAISLNNIAVVLRIQGEFADAAIAARDSVTISERSQDQANRAMALATLGGALTGLGEVAAARAALDEAYRLSDETGDQVNRAEVLNGLGRLQLLASDPRGARDLFDEARDVGQRIGEPEVWIEALIGLAFCALKLGDPAAAVAAATDANTLAERLRHAHLQAEAREALRQTMLPTNDLRI